MAGEKVTITPIQEIHPSARVVQNFYVRLPNGEPFPPSSTLSNNLADLIEPIIYAQERTPAIIFKRKRITDLVRKGTLVPHQEIPIEFLHDGQIVQKTIPSSKIRKVSNPETTVALWHPSYMKGKQLRIHLTTITPLLSLSPEWSTVHPDDDKIPLVLTARAEGNFEVFVPGTGKSAMHPERRRFVRDKIANDANYLQIALQGAMDILFEPGAMIDVWLPDYANSEIRKVFGATVRRGSLYDILAKA